MNKTELRMGILFPSLLQNQLERERPIDELDNQLVSTILGKFRYRLTAVGLVAQASDISAEQKLGVIEFVGLVNAADDLIDSDKLSLRDATDPVALRSQILQQPFTINEQSLIVNGTTVTIQDLYDRTMAKFSPEKQQLIDDFLNHSLAIETSTQSRKPGEYTFQQALEYRRKTSEEYSIVAAKLLGITDEEKIKQAVLGGRVAQALDDAIDACVDFQDESINLVIGMASDLGELDSLKKVSTKARRSSLGRILYARKIFRALPRTQKGYKEYFHSQVDSVTNNSFKRVMKSVGRTLW